jgi:outer membrane protein TolC
MKVFDSAALCGRRPTWVVGALLALGGCATFSPDGGFDVVSKIASERISKEVMIIASDDDVQRLQSAIERLQQGALSADAAVQIALFNNRGLQASFARLGIAEAERVQAGRLANWGFDFKHSSGGGNTVIERTLTVNLVAWLTLPLTARAEAGRFAQTQLRVADEALRLAGETRKAYFEAVAAEQGVAYAVQVRTAAEAGAELAGRMAGAGNFSQLDSAREQAFLADAEAGVLRASQAAGASRERLARLMGLSGTGKPYALSEHLPQRLPDLPDAALDLKDVEQAALDCRLDIRVARLAMEETARSLGLARATRVVNVFDLGYVNNGQSGMPSAPGYELSVEIPLFDWGQARSAKAQAIYMESAHRLAEAVVNARSESRESYLAYRLAYELARRYRDHIVPLRKRISDETLLRYNGMLISVFDLLVDAREQAAAVNGAITAQKDFWIAETRLQAALGGSLAAAPTSASVHGGQP